MFGLFKKKSKVEVLQKKYNDLLEQSFRLSKTNRSESDRLQMEADEVLKEMDALNEAK